MKTFFFAVMFLSLGMLIGGGYIAAINQSQSLGLSDCKSDEWFTIKEGFIAKDGKKISNQELQYLIDNKDKLLK